MQFESNQTVGQTTKRVIFDFFDKLKYPAKAAENEKKRHHGKDTNSSKLV